MPRVTVWHGDENALRALQDAVNHNCECKDGHGACAAHRLLTDQKTLDHLAFVHESVTVFLQAEFDPMAEFGT